MGDDVWEEKDPEPLQWGESARNGLSLWPQGPARTGRNVSVVCDIKTQPRRLN